jgi:hypothetical protein
MSNQPLLPEKRHIPSITRDTDKDKVCGILSTRDHEIIREWARHVGAEPATGERTFSGPATSMSVADGGACLRFNFPGFSRFRMISWDEWFESFNSHDLTFVYETGEAGEAPNARYRLVPTSELTNT